MSLARALVRYWLGLPPARGPVRRGDAWVKGAGGARLATAVIRPRSLAPRSTVVVRTPADVRAPRTPERIAAELLAEQGHAVVVQSCRGLHASEGTFEPFLHEARDGAALVDWALGDAALPRPLTLAGVGYAGHAAWAAQAARSEAVDALVVGFAASDPYAWLYAGGALQLDAALTLALAWTSGEPEGSGGGDPWRGVHHRPLRDADRVALRQLASWRGWVEHPERGPYWSERTAAPGAPPRHALLFGGLYDASLPALLADHARLAEGATGQGRHVQLRIGPWSAQPLPLRQRSRAAHREAMLAGAVVAFLDAVAGDATRSEPPVRVFVCGAGSWRNLPAWPDPGAQRCVLYLTGDGRSTGSLRPDPTPDDEPPDDFLYDPADATPSGGGASALEPGPQPFDSAEARGDVLAWATEPLDAPLQLVGPAHLALFTHSDAPAGDVCARLLAIDAAGGATVLADGIARTSAAHDDTPLALSLTPLSHQLPVGGRLALEISAARFPRFDRHPNTAGSVARASDDDGVVTRRSVFHDARRPSRIELLASGAATGS